MQNGGNNVNAGSTTNNTAAYTSTNGNWSTVTNKFTPTDGSTPASSVNVGEFRKCLHRWRDDCRLYRKSDGGSRWREWSNYCIYYRHLRNSTNHSATTRSIKVAVLGQVQVVRQYSRLV